MKKVNFSRRAVIRSAVASACLASLPLAQAADDDGKGKKTAPPEAAGAKKAPQASVQYQTKPKGDQKCGLCMHFIAESNTCKLVEGKISPDGWCVLWAKKA